MCGSGSELLRQRIFCVFMAVKNPLSSARPLLPDMHREMIVHLLGEV